MITVIDPVVADQRYQVVLLLALAYSAEIFGELTFHSMLSQIWALPFLIWLVVADVAHTNRWIVWAVITLLLSYPSRMLSSISHPPHLRPSKETCIN